MDTIYRFALRLFLVGFLGWAAAVPADVEPSTRSAGGLTVYLAVIPAQIARDHAASHVEAQMHPDVRHEIGEKHVLVALFDAAGNRITDAKVTITLVGIGSAKSAHDLEPMTVAGALTYGTFMSLPGTGRYDIEVQVQPHLAAPVIVHFAYTAPLP